jgi:hypothetical protein
MREERGAGKPLIREICDFFQPVALAKVNGSLSGLNLSDIKAGSAK